MDLSQYYQSVQAAQAESLAQTAQQAKEEEKSKRAQEVSDIFGAGLTAVATEEATTVGKKLAKGLGKKFLTTAGVSEENAEDLVNGRAQPLVRRTINRFLQRRLPPQEDIQMEPLRRRVTRTVNYNDLIEAFGRPVLIQDCIWSDGDVVSGESAD